MAHIRYSITLTREVAGKLEDLAYARRLEVIEQCQGPRGPRAADLLHEALGEYLAAHPTAATSQEGKCTTTIQ